MSFDRALGKVVKRAFCGRCMTDVLKVEKAGFFLGESVLNDSDGGGGIVTLSNRLLKTAVGGGTVCMETLHGDFPLGINGGGSKTALCLRGAAAFFSGFSGFG